MNRSGDLSETVADREARAEPRLGRFPLSSPHASRDRLPPRLDSYEGAALARARSRASGVSPGLFVMATALNTTVASILAVIITLGVVNQERSGVEPQDAAQAYARPAVAVVSEPAPANFPLQQVSLPPMGSPEQPLRLEPQRPAPLPLQVQPEQAANEPFILTLSGAPAGTMLFGANRISSDAWFLPSGSVGRLEIVLPEWSTTVFEVTIALRRTDGGFAAQTRAWLSVPPPASLSAAVPKTDEATAKELLARADRLIRRGDIVAARAIYQRATELGSGQAALALGSTYDPNRLWSLGALGLVGNKERAKQWYQRASELGHPEAKARLVALGF
jgi:hypothetical protein